MYDNVATLISYGESSFDAYGNEIIEITEQNVFVQPRSVSQSEYYRAAQVGLQPSLTLFISNRYDYAEQKIVRYEGKIYDVVRVDWRGQRDGISLICEEKVNEHNNIGSDDEDSE